MLSVLSMIRGDAGMTGEKGFLNRASLVQDNNKWKVQDDGEKTQKKVGAFCC